MTLPLTPTDEELQAIREIGNIVVESVADMGAEGAPESMVHLFLQSRPLNATSADSQKFITALIQAGRIFRKGDLLFATFPNKPNGG